MKKLKQHTITLRSDHVALRPMTEGDWDLLLKWNSDPEVIYFSEGDDVSHRSLGEVHGIYRGVSQSAFCFIIEFDGAPVGECWLQKMNLERILAQFPNLDCRRIDLMIGEKTLWGRGIGTEVIRLLTEFGFKEEGADAIFGCEVADYNPRSRRAFEKNGYVAGQELRQPEGMKAKVCCDLMLTRDAYKRTEGATHEGSVP